MPVDLLVPIKLLGMAKTRLRGAADGDTGALEAHTQLVLALARDTVAAAIAAVVVRQVVVICSDEVASAAFAHDGVRTIPDEPAAGLNPALRYGETVLRAADPSTTVGVLQADLPALRPDELDCAIRTALATADRAFCADRTGTGTTLLLASPGHALQPCFGPDSASAHQTTGARPLTGGWPGLRCDVDTAVDLTVAQALGLGPFTRAALAVSRPDVRSD